MVDATGLIFQQPQIPDPFTPENLQRCVLTLTAVTESLRMQLDNENPQSTLSLLNLRRGQVISAGDKIETRNLRIYQKRWIELEVLVGTIGVLELAHEIMLEIFKRKLCIQVKNSNVALHLILMVHGAGRNFALYNNDLGNCLDTIASEFKNSESIPNVAYFISNLSNVAADQANSIFTMAFYFAHIWLFTGGNPNYEIISGFPASWIDSIVAAIHRGYQDDEGLNMGEFGEQGYKISPAYLRSKVEMLRLVADKPTKLIDHSFQTTQPLFEFVKGMSKSKRKNYYQAVIAEIIWPYNLGKEDLLAEASNLEKSIKEK